MSAVVDRSDAETLSRTHSHAVVPGRAAVLLDVLMGLSELAGLIWVAALVENPRIPGWLTAAFLAVVLAMAALWVLRRVVERRSGRPARGLVVAFAVLGLLGLFVSAGPGSWPLFVMALLGVASSFRARVGVGLVLTVLLVQLVALLAGGQGWAEAGLEVAETAYVFAFVLVLAWLGRRARGTA